MSGLFTWAVSGRRLLRVRRVPAWRSATVGVEGADSYTAFGYANPTRRVLAGVLHTQAELHEVMMEENGRDDGSGPPDRTDPGWEEATAHLRRHGGSGDLRLPAGTRVLHIDRDSRQTPAVRPPACSTCSSP
ncbi:MAG TPA: hypothetical protein VK594_21525 [Streptosporangiaceae bacterium]|nr:hypothetical protein [Streptosporangiaceae bacterium]